VNSAFGAGPNHLGLRGSLLSFSRRDPCASFIDGGKCFDYARAAMTHLLVAEVFWILVVLASADQLFVNHNSGLLHFRKWSTGVNWNLGFKTADQISRGGGHS
jgi:hypothetical protein